MWLNEGCDWPVSQERIRLWSSGPGNATIQKSEVWLLWNTDNAHAVVTLKVSKWDDHKLGSSCSINYIPRVLPESSFYVYIGGHNTYLCSKVSTWSFENLHILNRIWINQFRLPENGRFTVLISLSPDGVVIGNRDAQPSQACKMVKRRLKTSPTKRLLNSSLTPQTLKRVFT